MNERQKKILTLLIKNPDYKIGNLEQELGLTRRQINYSLDQLNDLLVDSNVAPIKRNKVGDFFIPSELIQSLAGGQNYSNHDYINDSERRDLILLYLIVANHFISLDHIIDFVNVSKTTTIKDIKNANDYIQKHNLFIEYNRKDGYIIIGDEVDIRKLLSDLVVMWDDKLVSSEMFAAYFHVKQDQIIHFVSVIEQKLKVKYSSDSFKLLVLLLKFSLARMKKINQEININMSDLTKTTEYNLIEDTISKEWVSNRTDIEWITIIFLSSNIYKSSSNILHNNQILQLIEKMVEKFELRTLINIENKDDFVNRLYTHIRPAMYRISYGLSLERYNINSLITNQKHSILLSLIKDLIKPIEDFIGKSFPNEELQLLSLYFGSQLENKNQLLSMNKPKAVTVCANGLISSSMLKKTLENLFPEFDFLISISEREFYDYEEDFDVVFSTTVLETHIPQFYVDTLMSNEEQIRLRYNVLKSFDKDEKIEDINNFVNKIMVAIDKHSIVTNRSMLANEIEEIVVKNSNRENILSTSWNPNLTNYLKRDFITKANESLAWEEAIVLATKPLLEFQTIKEKYVDRIIEMIRSTNYMYLGDWMVIPHAESDGDIIKESISLLVSEKPIVFPNNKKIKMVVPIAITDTTKHLRAMNELSDISLNPQIISKFMESSEDKIYEIIVKMESRLNE